MMQTVPRINLDDYLNGDDAKKQSFIQTLGEGLCHYGFLVVENHGVDQDLTARAYAAYKAFFKLGETEKKAYATVAGGQRGYTPFGVEQAKDAKVPDLKEFWHVGQELADDHPYKNDYPNNVWPDEVPELREISLSLYKAYERCAGVILRALAEFFKLPINTFADMMVDGDSIYRVIHYPPLDEGMPAQAVRAAAHEDINLITLLTQSEGSGLELLTREGDWLAVNALDGDIVVDSGDMISRVTNGVVPATTHRVVNPDPNDNRERYSMPFFVHPYAKCDLSVMDTFVTDEQGPKWPPITAREFLLQRLREIGLV